MISSQFSLVKSSTVCLNADDHRLFARLTDLARKRTTHPKQQCRLFMWQSERMPNFGPHRKSTRRHFASFAPSDRFPHCDVDGKSMMAVVWGTAIKGAAADIGSHSDCHMSTVPCHIGNWTAPTNSKEMTVDMVFFVISASEVRSMGCRTGHS
jgi:hypothetical protein